MNLSNNQRKFVAYVLSRVVSQWLAIFTTRFVSIVVVKLGESSRSNTHRDSHFPDPTDSPCVLGCHNKSAEGHSESGGIWGSDTWNNKWFTEV